MPAATAMVTARRAKARPDPMNGSFIIPLAKVDVEKRLVIGRAVQEMVDKSGEILDYASARPAFEAWSKEMSEASGGLSKGNLRVMHSKTVAGKVIDITYNDDEKAIDVVTKVVDDNEWRKVLEGCYTGFSVGGSYAKKWKVGTNTHYTPKVSELSLVDMPCIPSAKFFELHKADGAVEKIEFKTVAVVDSDETPEPGDTIEFSDDAFVESGPCNCKVGAVDGDHLALDMGEDSNPDIVDWGDVSEDGVAMAAPREDGKPRRWFVSRKSADKSVEPEQLMKRAKVDRDKVAKVMAEFKAGTLKSSDGSTVTDRKQAMAIALSEARLSKSEPKPKRERKAKGKDGRAGRDGDGDGKLNESGDGGAGGSPPAAAALPPGGAPIKVEVVGQVSPKSGVIPGTRMEPGLSYAGLGAGAVAGAALGRFALSRRGLRAWQNIGGTLPNRIIGAAGRTVGTLTAQTYNAVTPRFLNLGGDAVRSIGAAGEKAGQAIGSGVQAIRRTALRGAFHGIYTTAGGPKRTKKIGAAIGAAYLGYQGFKAGRVVGSEIDRWRSREVDLTRAWAPLDLQKWGGHFDETKVKRDERGRFSTTAAAAGVAAGAAAGAAVGYGLGRFGSKAAPAKGRASAKGKTSARSKKGISVSRMAEYAKKGIFKPIVAQAIKAAKAGAKGIVKLPFSTKLAIAIGIGGVFSDAETISDGIKSLFNIKPEIKRKNFGFDIELTHEDPKTGKKTKIYEYDSISGRDRTFSIKSPDDVEEPAPSASGDASRSGSSASSPDSSFKDFMPEEKRSQVRASSMAHAARAISQRSDYSPKQAANIIIAARSDDRIDIHDKNDVYRAATKITHAAGTDEAEAQVASLIRDWNSGGWFSRSNPTAERNKRAAQIMLSAFAKDKGWLQSNVDRAAATTEILPWRSKADHYASTPKAADDGVDNRKGRDGDGDGKKNENDAAEDRIKAALKERNTLTIPGESSSPRVSGPRVRFERETESEYEDYLRSYYTRTIGSLSPTSKSVMVLDLMKAFDESKVKRNSAGKFASKTGLISSTAGYAGGSAAWHGVGDAFRRTFTATWPGKVVAGATKFGASLVGANVGERAGRVAEHGLGIKQRQMGRFETYGRTAGGVVGGILGGLTLGAAGAVAGSVIPGAGTIAGALTARVAGDTAGSVAGESAGGWIGRYIDRGYSTKIPPVSASLNTFAGRAKREPGQPGPMYRRMRDEARQVERKTRSLRAPKGAGGPRSPRAQNGVST